jgi:D-psicose/D-tagatose/L-ribulose 3-epimerase
MQYGIYYAFWERQWGGEYLKYVKKVADLGFDVLEISCASVPGMKQQDIDDLRRAAEDLGIRLTAGYGPKREEDLSSADPKIVQNGFDFWKRNFDVLAKLGVTLVGGGLYSYWPVDFSKPFNKEEDLKRSTVNIQKLGDLAAQYTINLGMEVLNRFEGYLINTAAEALAFVKAVGRDNVKIMLDTFHMNIEEDNFTKAIHTAGSYLGHLHIGEANRLPPYREGRIDWKEIAKALHDINYTGTVVMEPFVLVGGQIGNDIKVWRDLSNKAGEKELDEEARKSVAFIRSVFEAA